MSRKTTWVLICVFADTSPNLSETDTRILWGYVEQIMRQQIEVKAYSKPWRIFIPKSDLQTYQKLCQDHLVTPIDGCQNIPNLEITI